MNSFQVKEKCGESKTHSLLATREIIQSKNEILIINR